MTVLVTVDPLLTVPTSTGVARSAQLCRPPEQPHRWRPRYSDDPSRTETAP